MKKLMNKIVVVCLAVAIVFSFAACSTTNEPAAESSEAVASETASASAEDPGTEEEATSEAPATGTLVIPENVVSEKTVNISDFPEYTQPAEDQQLTFALLLFSRGFEWMIGLENEFKSTCEELGVEAIVLDAQSSDETQLNQIQDMITQKVDAIILTPNSNDGLIPGVEAANEAGIVLTTCEGIVTGGTVPLHVVYDNEQAGQLAADYIIDRIGESGTVLETRGALASLSATGRHTGFETVMQTYPDINFIAKNAEWVAVEAGKFTSDILTTNPELGAVYSNNDEMQTGIQSALSESGRLVKVGEDGHIVLVGIDGTPLALERIRDGIQDCSVVQDPFSQGRAITMNTYNFLMGEDVPEEEVVQPYIVTADTVDDPNLWGNKSELLK